MHVGLAQFAGFTFMKAVFRHFRLVLLMGVCVGGGQVSGHDAGHQMAEVAKAKRKTINLDGIMVQRCCWIHAALSAAHRSDLGI